MVKNKCKNCGSERLVVCGIIKDDKSKFKGNEAVRCEICGLTQVKK